MIDPDTAMKGFFTADSNAIKNLVADRVFDTFGIPASPKSYICFIETPHRGQVNYISGSTSEFIQMSYDIHCFGHTKTDAKLLSNTVQSEFKRLLEEEEMPVVLSPSKAPTVGLHWFTIRRAFSNHAIAPQKVKQAKYSYIVDMSMAFKEIIS